MCQQRLKILHFLSMPALILLFYLIKFVSYIALLELLQKAVSLLFTI